MKLANSDKFALTKLQLLSLKKFTHFRGNLVTDELVDIISATFILTLKVSRVTSAL